MIEEVRYIQPFRVVRHVKNVSSKLFYLSTNYTFQYKEDGRWLEYTVEKGFSTDFSSVPRPFRWLVSVTDAIEESAVHDHICRKGVRPREWADEMFGVMMKAAKRCWFRRNVMLKGVQAYTFFTDLGRAE